MGKPERYTAGELAEIDAFFKELARRTRKAGRISPSRRANIMAEWEVFDVDVVMEAISLYMRMDTTPAQNERYLKGIMRNRQKEKEARAYGKRGTGYQQETGTASGDEGERLRRKYAAGGGELVCDF